MRIARRSFLAGAAGALIAPRLQAEIDTSGLRPMTGDVAPIAAVERMARLERARTLMRAHKLDAVLIEPGSAMRYFGGIRWWRSERLTALVLPVRGQPVVVTPFFEEPSIRETLAIPADVRVWQEDEDPLALVAGALRDRGAGGGTIGVEETVRFFASDGLGRRLPQARLASADPVVRGCRLLKSPAEIALLAKANAITEAALRWTWARVRPGQTPGELMGMVNAATVALGGETPDGMALIGEASAYPHGSRAPQRVREGDAILFDCGCTVEGYTSDISRTAVLGRAPDAVRRVWDTVAEGQQVAIRAARVGAPAGSVDDAVRAFYTGRGYGPGYRLPGLSHRTGHGIGLDGHEPVNLVHGERTPLAPGMCFSDEPGLYLPGRFGVRLEDCWHMTEAGPRWFTTPPASLDRPFG